MGTILITDGGPHPAGKWAELTAREIAGLIQIEPTADRSYSTAKRKAEILLIDVLEDHHGRVQQAEQTKLLNDAVLRFADSLDPSEHLTQALADIIKSFEGTPFAEHFATEDAQAAVLAIIANHFSTSMDIERRWHADRNPTLAAGQAYKAGVAAAA